jgi:GH24 family phage-related lysozyme (muramidase)
MNPILAIIQRKIKVKLNDNQIAALASFIYNTGGSATLFSLINSSSPQLYDW